MGQNKQKNVVVWRDSLEHSSNFWLEIIPLKINLRVSRDMKLYIYPQVVTTGGPVPSRCHNWVKPSWASQLNVELQRFSKVLWQHSWLNLGKSLFGASNKGLCSYLGFRGSFSHIPTTWQTSQGVICVNLLCWNVGTYNSFGSDFSSRTNIPRLTYVFKLLGLKPGYHNIHIAL